MNSRLDNEVKVMMAGQLGDKVEAQADGADDSAIGGGTRGYIGATAPFNSVGISLGVTNLAGIAEYAIPRDPITIAEHIDGRLASLRQQIEELERVKYDVMKAGAASLPIETLRDALY